MSFFKNRGKVLLTFLFCIFLILQQIALWYGRSYRTQTARVDGNGNDKLVLYEINQLEEVWRKAAVNNLITPQLLADQVELKQARARLEEVEKGIVKSEERVQGVTGKKREFFQKVHAYYNHSVTVLTSIIDFLLARTEEYSVNGNEINFDSEADGESFRELINQLSFIYQEKEELDAFILKHNRDLEKEIASH